MSIKTNDVSQYLKTGETVVGAVAFNDVLVVYTQARFFIVGKDWHVKACPLEFGA